MYAQSPAAGPSSAAATAAAAHEEQRRYYAQHHQPPAYYQHQRHASSPRPLPNPHAPMNQSQPQPQPLPQPYTTEKENAPLRAPSPSKKNRNTHKTDLGRSAGEPLPASTTASFVPASPSKSSTSPLALLASVGKSAGRSRQTQNITQPIADIDEEFERLMNTLEVPASLRSKLLGMDRAVKESMVRGQTLVPAAPSTARARSGSMPGALIHPASPHALGVHLGSSTSGGGSNSVFAGPSRSGSANTIALQAHGAGAKEVPEFFATHLKANDAGRIDVARVRRLRVLLGSESPLWAADFVQHRGMAALCTRLRELVDMEWREEQHDDQLLHEILRCLAVLVKTETGRTELRDGLPEPCHALVDLVFSEKKPGDLGTRKLIFDLITHLFTLRIAPSDANARGLAAVQGKRHLGRCTQKVGSAAQRMRYAVASPGSPPLLGNHPSAGSSADWVLSLVLALVSNPRTPESESMLDFISASHTPRPFKTYLLEVSSVCRDYFWIFCHAQNRFWDLAAVNVDDVEAPKVPGGATGSVEFEAMAYLTCHLRLLNTIASVLVERHGFAGLSDGASAAYDFYTELFASGMERILAVLRKSSQVYYQPTHLELARFFHLAARARYGIPPGLQVWQSVAPSLLRG